MALGTLQDFKGKSSADLVRDIIDVGLCTACGSCAAVCGQNAIFMNGEEPLFDFEKCTSCGMCSAVCPGKDICMPELEIELFGRPKDERKQLLGQYRNCYVSHSADDNIMLNGASAGTAASILLYALEKDIIDGVICVGFDNEEPWKPIPILCTSRAEILESQGSKYTHCSVNDMLKIAAERSMRIAVVGLPCVIHGIRKMQHYMPNSPLVKHIIFTIGLFCGENRFTVGAEHIIEKRIGVPLKNVAKISYRAGAYPGAFTVWDKQGNTFSIPYPDQLTFIWMHTRPRCRICWDYSAELADISLGETQHLNKKLAHNAAFVRTEIGETIFNDAIRAGYIHADDVEEKMIFNHTGLERKKYANLLRIEWVRHHGMPHTDYPQQDVMYRDLPDFYFGPKR